MRAALLALLLGACASPPPPATDTAPEPDPCSTHAYPITWDNGGEAFFLSHCRSCHSETATDRGGAPEYLNYDTFASVYAARHAIRQAALWDRVMPPGLPLNAENGEMLEAFLDCLD